MSNEADTEKEIQAKGLIAPRLTPELIDSVIKEKTFLYHRTLTICILELANGFFVTGESAAASPENYDAELGRKIAYENARHKVWAFEGYLLRQRIKEGKV